MREPKSIKVIRGCVIALLLLVYGFISMAACDSDNVHKTIQIFYGRSVK